MTVTRRNLCLFPFPRQAACCPSIPLAGGYQVRFLGLPDSTYTVLRTPAVTGPWTTLGVGITSTTGWATFTDTNPPPGSAFYLTTFP